MQLENDMQESHFDAFFIRWNEEDQLYIKSISGVEFGLVSARYKSPHCETLSQLQVNSVQE